LRNFVIGLIVGLIVVPLCIYIYFVTGMAPVATAAPPMPFERMLAGKALDARIKKEMTNNVPPAISYDDATLTAGAQIYVQQCANCHGLPQQPPSSYFKGMAPRPPQLFRGKGVTDDDPGETFWKVSNGIRMTGMPSFQNTLNKDQMWQVTIMLSNTDKLPQAAREVLANGKLP
jgi:mono/diheme cytochrome c family protein